MGGLKDHEAGVDQKHHKQNNQLEFGRRPSILTQFVQFQTHISRIVVGLKHVLFAKQSRDDFVTEFH